MKDAAFDGRYHVGLGSWPSCLSITRSPCSGPLALCRATPLRWTTLRALLWQTVGAMFFADADEANAFYEDSWAAARTDCET